MSSLRYVLLSEKQSKRSYKFLPHNTCSVVCILHFILTYSCRNNRNKLVSSEKIMPTSTREYYVKWAILQWLLLSIFFFKQNAIGIFTLNFLLFILFGFFIVSWAISHVLCFAIDVYISKNNDSFFPEEISPLLFAQIYHFRKVLVVAELFVLYFIARFTISFLK